MSETNDAPMKPLVFCNRSVIAWQRGAKTQTRRLVRPLAETKDWRVCQNSQGCWEWQYERYWAASGLPPIHRSLRQPHSVGDLLWIREGLRRLGTGIVGYEVDEYLLIGLNDGVFVWNWKRNKLPAMFMPRWACRYYAKVLSVRPERLQDISDEDAVAEGVLVYWHNLSARSTWYQGKSQSLYLEWWDDLHKKPGTRSEDNPWVWVYELEPIDEGR